MTAPDYTPDPDASPLDRAVMELAARLHAAGWTEDAEGIASSMAELRETPRNPGGNNTADLHDALEGIAGAARHIAEVIERTHPDPHQLRRQG